MGCLVLDKIGVLTCLWRDRMFENVDREGCRDLGQVQAWVRGGGGSDSLLRRDGQYSCKRLYLRISEGHNGQRRASR